jgi:intracellular sulfur oxidation DsrE/DsrF family protein
MKFLRSLILGAIALAAAILPAAAQTPKADDTFKVALHVDDNDAARMNLALNNVQNILADLKKAGRKVDIQVVTYGPGLHMFRDDTSPVKARIQEISLANPNVTFAACGNTQALMTKAEKKEIKLINEAKLVPSGIVHLVELQRQGYAYVKP